MRTIDERAIEATGPTADGGTSHARQTVADDTQYSGLTAADNPPYTRLWLMLNAHRKTRIGRLLHAGKFATLLGLALGSEVFDNCNRTVVLRHPYGIVIHPKAVIGDRVVIMQGGTVGARSGRGVPVIEDDVYIGAGAKVLGGIRLGRGARIGANAVVTRDVAPGHTIVGANEDLTARSLERRRA